MWLLSANRNPSYGKGQQNIVRPTGDHPSLALSIGAAELRLVLWDTFKGLKNNLILTQLSGFFNRKYEFHAQKLREALAQGPSTKASGSRPTRRPATAV